MLEKFDILECKPQTISLPVGISLSITNGSEIQKEIEEMKKIPYRKALRSLM